MTQRYFLDGPLESDEVVLAGPEAHHLASVMRASPGNRVVLFDGAGVECDASVLEVRKRDVRLRIEARRNVDRESNIELTLAVALPKGERQRWLVEKATELGVKRMIPLSTRRSIVEVDAKGVERMTRFVVEACKQCGRNRLMQIEPSVAWNEFIDKAPAESQRIIAHPMIDEERRTDCQVRPESWTDLAIRPTESPVVAAVGPEGGFTDEEFQAGLQAGWRPVSLGPRILRVETAALVLGALLLVD